MVTDGAVTSFKHNVHMYNGYDIGINTNIEVIVVTLTTWEALHIRPRAVVSFPGR